MTRIVLNNLPEALLNALAANRPIDDPVALVCQGKDYVVLPLASYEELERRLEEFEDARDLESAVAALDKGEVPIPYDKARNDLGLR